MATGHLKPRKTKDGKTSYQIVIELDRDPVTGKRDRRYKTVNGTKKQAEKKLHELIHQYNSGNVVSVTAMKLCTWVDNWLTNFQPNLAATTRDGYEEKIKNYIKPSLGNIPLSNLNANDVQLWVNGLTARGLSPKTIRNAFNILNPALKKAVFLRMIPFNPCDGVVLPKLHKPEIEVYDRDESKQVLEMARDTDIYLIVLLGLSVGLRRGEIAGLKWSHIDFAKKTITICENRVHAGKKVIEKCPKSSAGKRMIPIGEELVAELRKAKEKYDHAAESPLFQNLGYVVCKEDGTAYHPDSITQKWERFTKRNGLHHIKLHGMRHTNATALIQAGVSDVVVKERLGHSDVTTTLRYYAHVLPSMNQEAADKIDNMLLG